MSNLNITFDALLSAWENAWIVNLELISGGILALVIAALIYKPLAHWRNRAVQRALNAEYERQCEDQLFASIAEGEKRYGLELALHSVWDEVTALSYALHGTSQQIEDDLWEISQVFGTPKLALVLPECYRPFQVELTAINRGLTHLGSQIDNARAEREDLNFYKEWVEELWARFRLFELKNNNQQRRLQSRLSGIRELHVALGKEYCLSTISPVYQSFSGMLHIVEMMIDDNSVPAEQMSAYATALTNQLSKLAVSFECKRYGLLSDEDSFLNMLLATARK